MAAGGGNLERALGGLLTFHVLQVGRLNRVFGKLRHRRAQHLDAFHVVDEGDERWRGDDVGAAGPGSFRAAFCRANEPSLRGRGRQRRRQHARHRRHLGVQRKLAKCRIAGQFVRRQHTHHAQKSECDGQIVMAAFLGQIRRREIDGNALIGQREADGGQG